MSKSTSSKQSLPFLRSLKELMAQPVPPSDWIVDGLLRTGRRRVSLLAGEPEAGKSTLARQLAVAVSKGQPFLGRQTVRGQVVYWQTEEADGDLQDSFGKLGYDRQRDEEIHIFVGDGQENNFSNLNKTLRAFPDIRLVIIETLDDLLRIEEIKGNTEARKAFEKFENAVVKHHYNRVAFMALHHLNKNMKRPGRKQEQVSLGNLLLGATYVRGRTDAKWYVYAESDEPEAERVFTAHVRTGLPVPKTYLKFARSTETATLGVTVVAQRRKQAEQTAHNLEREILKYHERNPNTTKKECFHAVKGNSDAKREAHRRLVQLDRLRPSGSGTKTSPFRYSVVKLQIEGKAA